MARSLRELIEKVISIKSGPTFKTKCSVIVGDNRQFEYYIHLHTTNKTIEKSTCAIIREYVRCVDI